MAGTLLPVFEHAAISLVHRDGRIDTVASSDDVGGIVDRVQYETGQGPCLSAIRKDPVQLTGDLATEGRWRQSSGRAVAETGVRLHAELAAVPGEDALRALSPVQPQRGRLRRPGAGVRSGAGRCMRRSRCRLLDDHEEVEHLEEALSSSRVIGTAQGILMVQVKVDRAQAFRILVQGSQAPEHQAAGPGGPDRQRGGGSITAGPPHVRRRRRPRKALRSAAAERAWSVGARRRSSKASAQVGDSSALDPRPGEEGDLLAHVHPGP